MIVFAKYVPLEFMLKLDDKDMHSAMLNVHRESEELIVKVHVYFLTDCQYVDMEQ